MDSRKYIIFFCSIICATSHEFYSSTDQISRLAEKERDLLNNFSYYIEDQEEHLKELRSVLLELKSLYYSARMDPVVSNPVASYKLLKRVRLHWEIIVTYATKSLFPKFQDYLDEEMQHVPQMEDIQGAALGILRLQELYKFYPQNLTVDAHTGRVLPLSPDDCFHLGKTAFNENQFQHAFLWLLHTLSQLYEGQEAQVTQAEVLEYLHISAYYFGDLDNAIRFSQDLIQLYPTDTYAQWNVNLYKHNRLKLTSNPDIMTLNQTSGSSYEALCRGEAASATSGRRRQLHCRYSVGGGTSTLTYLPVKVEEVWDEPSIIRYHDVVSESEMEILKELSRPVFKRSKVTGNEEVSRTRTSQTAWVSDKYDPVVSRITQRLSYITGLDMESSETLQVVNYGIGGEFKPHFDAGDDVKTSKGHRIASIIIYLSDVEVGGATVFPEVGVSVQPLKGSAVLWYNLLQNGDLSDLSLHAGCPVVQGSKWIAVKWVYERGQEFRRPCSLSETE